VLEALNIENAHIAGISYGGEVAQAFVLKYPEKVRSLILIDTVSEVGPELRLVIQSWVDALRTGDALAFFNATVPWNFSQEFIANNTTLLEDARKRYALLDFPAIIRLCEAFFAVDFTERLGEIKVPTCIMVGQLDLLKGPRYAEILRRGIQQSEYHILRGSGHASCWERPEEFNSVILGFLAKQA
jgi:pimeloyl-ACP methyl ester carboxylesterase